MIWLSYISYPDYVSEDLKRTLFPDEATLGCTFEQNGKSVFVAPSLSGRNPEWAKFAAASDLTLIDGTFWSDDELQRVQGSGETAHQMGHIPVEESLRLLKDIKVGRKMFIHLNNTNPILNEASAERKAVRAAGWEVAEDNWQLELYNDGVHLTGRAPLIPCDNFFGSHPPSPYPHSAAERAAIIASATFEFKQKLEAGELEYEMINEQPVGKYFYEWFFNSSREPRIGRDEVMKYPGNDYLVAFRHGRSEERRVGKECQ